MIIVLERLSFNLMVVLINVVLFPLASTFGFPIWRNGSINFYQLEVLDMSSLLQVQELWIMRKLDGNMLLGKFLDFSTKLCWIDSINWRNMHSNILLFSNIFNILSMDLIRLESRNIFGFLM